MSAPITNQYLLEIGTEELPAGFLATAPSELAENVKIFLKDARLGYEDVTIHATPRRLAVLINGLAGQQTTEERTVKGPPTRIALDEAGKPTQAGLGFAKKAGVDFSAVTRQEIDGETYLVVQQTDKGRPAANVLQDAIPDLIQSLSGSHFMVWGNQNVKFSRPIRWLVSLWNNEHLPLTLEALKSDRYTYGHRVLSEGKIEITSPETYVSVLAEKGKVLADFKSRRSNIWKDLQAKAAEVNGNVPENEELLDTVARLVEYPWVLVGSFEEKFLALPREVLVTVMAAHQKYFPVEDAKTGKLLPYFLVVANGRPEAADTIRLGNERVIRARFEDARFFFEEDTKQPLESRLEDLKGVMFQKGLGTLFEKSQRLEELSGKVAGMLGYDKAVTASVKQAARLSKTDLVTHMVRELTELQGEMGASYARLEGLPSEVCNALFEQYLPRFMGDAVAGNPVGIAVSLADKMDTIVAVFSQEKAKLPSGSRDPLGLRRMAGGIIQTVLENNLSLDLEALHHETYASLGTLAGVPEEQVFALVKEFILQRFRGVLLDQGYRYDVIDAVLEAPTNPLTNLTDAVERIGQLKAVTQDEKTLKALYEPANRTWKILGEHYNPAVNADDVKPEHFEHDVEKALYNWIITVDTAQPYETYVKTLQTGTPQVEAFFDGVLVNDPDEQRKKNRYNVLSLLNRLYLRLGVFSTLVV